MIPEQQSGAAAGRTGFGTRFLVAQTVVVFGGAVLVATVAMLVAPQLFGWHMRQAGIADNPEELRHLKDSYRTSVFVAVAVALASSVVVGAAVSWYLTRRMRRLIGTVVESTANIAAGEYGLRVRPRGLGSEFTELARSVNHLAERLETVEQIRQRMLSDLAHELRTPITSINAQVEVVEDGIREPGPPMYDAIRSATERLQRLADDIDAVSRAGEGQLRIERRSVTVGDLIGAAVTEAAPEYDAAEIALVQGPVAAVTVDVDPARVGQTLANLLGNARRHTPAGGTVTVAAQRTAPGSVAITVTDNGEGIAPEHLPHVFDRFFRGDSSRTRRGSGIGLTIARALAEAHGGALTASSPGVGGGAEFTLTLPINEGR